MIWVGTDDGRLHVTRDGGESWTCVEKNVRGVPANTWIPHVVPSPHAAGAAFVVFDNHRRSDWKPYVYRTDDYGKTWKSLATPELRGYALAIVQDPVDPELLFLGTEFGLWVSLRRRRELAALEARRADRLGDGPRDPPARARPDRRHARPRPLRARRHAAAARTRRRGARRARSTCSLAADAAQHRRLAEDGGFGLGASEFRGENRPYGAIVTFAVDADDLPLPDAKRERERKEKERAGERASGKGAAKGAPAEEEKEKEEPETKVAIEIRDAAGALVRRERVKVNRGLNRWSWDLGSDELRRPPSDEPEEDERSRSGPEVPPGRYTLTARFRGAEASVPVTVLADPSSRNGDAEWQARWRAIREAGALHDTTVAAIDRLRATRADIEAVDARQRNARREELRRGELKAKELPLASDGEKLRESLGKLEKRLWQAPDTVGIVKDEDVLSLLAYVRGYLDSSWDPPSPTHLEYLRQVRVRLAATLDEVNRFYAGDVEAYRAKVDESGVTLLPQSQPLTLP